MYKRQVKKHPATSFNFSAVAKGYACDVLAEMLRRNGSGNVMVEIGGEVTAFGHSPRGDSWRLQIDCPVDQSDVPTHEAIDYLEITDCGVATSGNYRNYHESSFGRVGHTIDPVTGYPRVSNILSATVIAPDCAQADAWACLLYTSARRCRRAAAPQSGRAVPMCVSDCRGCKCPQECRWSCWDTRR